MFTLGNRLFKDINSNGIYPCANIIQRYLLLVISLRVSTFVDPGMRIITLLNLINYLRDYLEGNNVVKYSSKTMISQL